jgi:hypothetical protein
MVELEVTLLERDLGCSKAPPLAHSRQRIVLINSGGSLEPSRCEY